MTAGCVRPGPSPSSEADAPVPAASAPAPPLPPRPNIVLVFADDHAQRAISAYDRTLTRTPSIDRIAKEGMRFEQALVTNSVCGPMRAVVQTGTYSHVNGFMVNRQVFDGSQQTFVKLLAAAGYQTALIGKWHLGSEPTGFDHHEILDGQGQYYNPPFLSPTGTTTYHGYVTDIIAERTDHWLTHVRDPSRPFVLLTQHKAPHRRWEPALRHLSLFTDGDLPEPATLFDDYTGRGRAAHEQDMTIADSLTDRDLKLTTPPDLDDAQRAAWEAAYGPRNAEWQGAAPKGRALVRRKYQRYVKDYLRCVAALDEAVGALLDRLDALGLSDNTLVVYSSDQGFFLGEHGFFDKRWMYEPSFHTPLLVRWPGVIAAGSINRDLVSLIDLPETFLHAAGVAVPEDMQGRSLVPLLQGRRPSDWRQSLYYHYYEHPGWHYVRRHYGVTDGRYKLMHFYEPDVDEWELYDTEGDPQELHNRANDPALREVRARLEAELARLRRELQVPPTDPPDSLYADPPPRMRPLPSTAP